MSINSNTSLSRIKWLLTGGLLGYFVALYGGMLPTVSADVRETPPRAAFQSGAERSETILREIAATLKTMDGRLERLEKIATDRKVPPLP